MSKRLHSFAAKYSKKFGGDLTVEGCETAKDRLAHEDLSGVDIPEDIVSLCGYLQSNPSAPVEGADGKTITTSYVVGFALEKGVLFAITKDKVYRLKGPWMGEVITSNPFLNSLWQEVKEKFLETPRKKV